MDQEAVEVEHKKWEGSWRIKKITASLWYETLAFSSIQSYISYLDLSY